MATTFEYSTTAVKDIRVEKTVDDTGKTRVTGIVLDGEVLEPSPRFWTSMYALYGFSGSIFKYFDHAEVFERIAQVQSNDTLRYCVARDDDCVGHMLAVSKPDKPIVGYEDLMEQLTKFGGSNITYSDGIVESVHAPRVGGSFQISGDFMENRFMMATPIDGYGMPNIYLSLLRQICTNGVIGYAKAFKSGLTLGKGDENVIPSIVRALDGFNSDEGFAAIRSRMERSAESWASVREVTDLYKIVTKLMASKQLLDNGLTVPTSATSLSNYLLFDNADRGVGVNNESTSSVILRAFHKMTGDVSALYGLANMDALSTKRQSSLPVKCSVYDAVNYATELATHLSLSSNASRALQAWVGGVISNDYDLEGSKAKHGSFTDFHVMNKLSENLTGTAA